MRKRIRNPDFNIWKRQPGSGVPDIARICWSQLPNFRANQPRTGISGSGSFRKLKPGSTIFNSGSGYKFWVLWYCSAFPNNVWSSFVLDLVSELLKAALQSSTCPQITFNTVRTLRRKHRLVVHKLVSQICIPDPDPVFLPIPDPGSRAQKGTGSRIRIRNTVANHPQMWHLADLQTLSFLWFAYLYTVICGAIFGPKLFLGHNT